MSSPPPRCGDKRSFGRENAIVLTSFSDEKLVDLFRDHSQNVTNSQDCGCWLWCGSTQNGYPSVSQGHGKSKLKILSAWHRYRKFPASNEVVSHLCHRKLCINPDHLVIETITSNNSRKGCLCRLIDGNNSWDLCWHTPKCIRCDTDTVGSFVPTCQPTA